MEHWHPRAETAQPAPTTRSWVPVVVALACALALGIAVVLVLYLIAVVSGRPAVREWGLLVIAAGSAILFLGLVSPFPISLDMLQAEKLPGGWPSAAGMPALLILVFGLPAMLVVAVEIARSL